MSRTSSSTARSTPSATRSSRQNVGRTHCSSPTRLPTLTCSCIVSRAARGRTSSTCARGRRSSEAALTDKFEIFWRLGLLALRLDALLAFVARVVHVSAHRVVIEFRRRARGASLLMRTDVVVRRIEPGGVVLFAEHDRHPVVQLCEGRCRCPGENREREQRFGTLLRSPA